MEGKGPPSDGQSTQNALNRFAEKKLSPNNGQSNGREDSAPYIRSGADTPISDSVRPLVVDLHPHPRRPEQPEVLRIVELQPHAAVAPRHRPVDPLLTPVD